MIAGFNEPTRHIEIDYLGYVWVTHPHKGVYRLEINEARDSVISIDEFASSFINSQNISVKKLNNRIVFTTEQQFYTYDYVTLCCLK